MQKSWLSVFLVLTLFSCSFVLAENETTVPEDDVAFETDAGIGPDSIFYGVDTFLDDTFGDPLEVREERAAELAEALEAGDEESATEAKEGYDSSADEVETEITPEDEERATRSARAIQGHLKKFDHQYARDVEGREDRIAAAAEVSATIKKLCTKLAKLDPEEYARTCRAEGDAPQWQQKMHKALTEEQRQEAEKLVSIMKGCFESDGKECACEEIEQEAFKATCTEVAPLAAACSEGDEEACADMEAVGDPFETLPDYLQEIVRGLDSEYQEAQFENHLPKECREEGVTSPEACRKLMIQAHAPEECREALADVKDEREARAVCDTIMFEQNAPEECVEAGLSSPQECSKLMWDTRAPEECKEAGLKGERGDERRCEEIMKKFHSQQNNQGPGKEGEFRGPALGAQCRELKDPTERLKCFESTFEDVKGREFRGEFQQDHQQQFDQRHEEFKDQRQFKQFPPECEKAGATTPEACRKLIERMKRGPGSPDEQFRPENNRGFASGQEPTEADKKRFEQNQQGRQGEFQGRPEEQRREEFREEPREPQKSPPREDSSGSGSSGSSTEGSSS